MWVDADSVRITVVDIMMAISMSPMNGAKPDHYFIINISERDICREPKYLVLEYLEYIRR